VRSLHVGFAVWVDVHVKSHRVAADGAVLDVVLARTSGNIHWDHDLFAAGVADIGSFKMGDWSSAAAGFLWFLHVQAGTLQHIVARLMVVRNP
jgi:hypothetical protein